MAKNKFKEKNMKKIGNCLGFRFSRWFSSKLLVSLMLFFMGLTVMAQVKRVTGTVVDSNNEPLYGVTIVVKGKPGVGVITDVNGKFAIEVDNKNSELVVSFLGMESQVIDTKNLSQLNVVLKEDTKIFDEVIIVGYGQQKKESVVGSITQTSGKVLERAGGVTNLGAALTGNLPGVVTSATSGMPGNDDPKIVIRTQSSWNNSDPLVLVDGIERSMSSVDISSVESISVLKDASATAVYGVKGANGVILITTKRGKEGKASIQIKGNVTAKVVSKLPAKYDSYDALLIRNKAIERELMLGTSEWGEYIPKEIIDKYRNPLNAEEWDRYPNVDWRNELFEDYAMSYSTSVNVSGGSKFASYFTAVDYLHEGDMFKTIDNGRGYEGGFGFNRINVRSNLDFNLTKTTKFSTNLFGSNGVREVPWDMADNDGAFWASAYRTSPDAMRPIYSDGTWGYHDTKTADLPNSVEILANAGVEKRTTTQINTDFILTQQLDFVTEGLSVKGTFSMDNSFLERKRGINDLYNYSQRKRVNPYTGDVAWERQIDAGTRLDFTETVRWQKQGGEIDKWQLFRKIYYSAQMNYSRAFGKNNVTAMGLFSRESSARGPQFYNYREDWVFRTTYNYDSKYFIEANGAYNGSEKFGPGYRFDFFPSISGGWMLSGENFMQGLRFLDMFKLRASWGRIGDDKPGNRFLFADQWTYGENSLLGDIPASTPYTYYRQSTLGNPNVSWETVEKRNFGVDYSFLEGAVAGSVDVFSDNRKDILLTGDRRAIPSYFGVNAPTANLGEVTSNGFEIELRLQHQFNNGARVWANTNMTHAENTVKFRDDPELLPAYRKQAGYAIDQTRAYVDHGFIKSWDDVYGSTERVSGNLTKLPGDFNVIDFNGDGIINDDDVVPYQYSTTPQNTYSTTIGFDWKGFGCSVQFYGVNNVTRDVPFPTFHNSTNVVFVEGTYWSPDQGGDIPLPRRVSLQGNDAAGTRFLYDASYLRLKNAEISYTFSNVMINRIGFKSCRLYVNGSNLFLWTDMPDDRESNFGGYSGAAGAYPTVKRFNLGIDITL